MAIENRTHGIASTYYHGCRCKPCRKAAHEWRRTRGLVKPTPEEEHDAIISEILEVLYG